MTNWNKVKNTEELAAHWAAVAKLDCGFAAKAQAFWHNQDTNSLRALRAGAWDANDSEQYMLARSYLTMRNAS